MGGNKQMAGRKQFRSAGCGLSVPCEEVPEARSNILIGKASEQKIKPKNEKKQGYGRMTKEDKNPSTR